MYNTREPAQALANMESMTVEAVFVLKDFHRHMDDPVVVRRLRDVGQKFATNRRTVIITAPEITIPPELAKLVEYFDLSLPDRERLGEIVHETFTRLSKTYTLKLQLDAVGVDAIAANLRGLTEEEAERAISQALVMRYALCAETISDVIEAKKQLLRHSGMLEFIEAAEDMAGVGGLENLKHWLAQRRGAWEDAAREFGLEPPKGVIILGVQGCGKSLCARAVAGEWKLPLVKFDTSAVYDKYIRRDGEANPKGVSGGGGACALRAVDRRIGKSLCRQRAGFGIGRRRSFGAAARLLPFVDAGSEGSCICGRNVEQCDSAAAGVDPQRPV